MSTARIISEDGARAIRLKSRRTASRLHLSGRVRSLAAAKKKMARSPRPESGEAPFTIENARMAKIVFGLGFVISLAILAIAVTGEPSAGEVEAPASVMSAAALGKTHCATREVSLDEGYGISRKILQSTCPAAD